jgi:hypothetical protein
MGMAIGMAMGMGMPPGPGGGMAMAPGGSGPPGPGCLGGPEGSVLFALILVIAMLSSCCRVAITLPCGVGAAGRRACACVCACVGGGWPLATQQQAAGGALGSGST